jgi:UDP-N-acetylglucosamine 2-epimerase (non-hydrolysing)
MKQSRFKIAVIVGTRPEAIKMVPVYLALKACPEADPVLIVTAQHRHLLDQVLEQFGVVPDIDLNLMSANQSLAEISAKIIQQVQISLNEIQPDAVLVHGDTTTCFFSALAAFYERIPVGHVEAGLRTHNFMSPWPEEMNRRLTDPICRWCFAPTEGAAKNLAKEGIDKENIFVTGNTIIDALLLGREKVSQTRPCIKELPEEALEGKRLILVTGHRRESFGVHFENICRGLLQIVEEHRDTVLVYPVHLNPNVQEPVHRILGNQERIFLIEPVEYIPFVWLMEQSYLIITDSGGIQEEAPTLQKPVLITRQTTERPEAVEAGAAILAGQRREDIVQAARILLTDHNKYSTMLQKVNPYGDGQAGKRIVEILLRDLTSR